MDVVLVTPDSQGGYLRRTVGDAFLEGLSAFFGRAAADWHPEASLPSFQDPVLGLEMSVVSSTPTRVGLVVRVVEDLEADVPSSTVSTSRPPARSGASRAGRARFHVGSRGAGPSTSPDWS
jgi:hypothetical protein